MKVRVSCGVVLAVMLLMGNPVEAQEYFESVNLAYEHIFVAQVERGEVVRLGRGEDSRECGNRYEALIGRTVKGQSNRAHFTFFSTERLMVGQSYLVYYSPADAQKNRLSPWDTVDIAKCRSRMKGPLLTYKELHAITESWNGSSTDLVVEIDDVWAESKNVKLEDVVQALLDAGR